jgi:hypothetical protein
MRRPITHKSAILTRTSSFKPKMKPHTRFVFFFPRSLVMSAATWETEARKSQASRRREIHCANTDQPRALSLERDSSREPNGFALWRLCRFDLERKIRSPNFFFGWLGRHTLLFLVFFLEGNPRATECQRKSIHTRENWGFHDKLVTLGASGNALPLPAVLSNATLTRSWRANKGTRTAKESSRKISCSQNSKISMLCTIAPPAPCVQQNAEMHAPRTPLLVYLLGSFPVSCGYRLLGEEMK